MISLGVATAVAYKEVGFIGGDLQFMLWFVAGLIGLFTMYRLSAMSDRLFPNRPSMWRTWRTALILITIILMLGVPAGEQSRAANLAFNINAKYENISNADAQTEPIINIYNRGAGDQLVISGVDGEYYLIANGKKEPILIPIPGTDTPAPKVRESAKEEPKK